MVNVGLLPEILLVLFIVLAESYWVDARDFYFKSKDSTYSIEERQKFAEKYNKADYVFRTASLGALLSLGGSLTLILNNLTNFSFSSHNLLVYISGALLSTAVLLLIYILGKVISGDYIVDYMSKEDLLSEIERQKTR